jgi:hypothetical protein
VCPNAIARHFITNIVQNIVYDEQNNGNHNRHSQSSFANNRPEWCTDEKEYKTGKRQGEFSMPFNPMSIDDALSGSFRHRSKHEIVPIILGFGISILQDCVACLQIF